MQRTLGLKLLVVGIITVVIAVALGLVNSTIADRQQYRDQAVSSIEQSYAGPQVLVGPVLVRPYTQTSVTTEDGQKKGTRMKVPHIDSLTATSFPRELDVRGTLSPSVRRHGLYSVTVYEWDGHLRGHLDAMPFAMTGTVAWGEPYLMLSVADVGGIVGTPRVTVNGVPLPVFQDATSASGWQPNLRVPLRGTRALDGRVDFAIDLNLAGTESLGVAPVGDANHIELASSWRSPLFGGVFLPRSSTVGGAGFTAAWDLSSLAARTQAQLGAKAGSPIDTVSVSLLTPIDPYKLSDRATKYGLLFVVLTFGGFFLFEVLRHLPIHPVQYLLVGFGLAIFFLLLVSFSEHMGFATAYGLASVACIGLLTFYLSYVLRGGTRGLGFGAMLGTLYAAVYGLLISEENALVLGSLLLFAMLAAVMVVTRRVDWYATGTSSHEPVVPPPGLAA